MRATVPRGGEADGGIEEQPVEKRAVEARTRWAVPEGIAAVPALGARRGEAHRKLRNNFSGEKHTDRGPQMMATSGASLPKRLPGRAGFMASRHWMSRSFSAGGGSNGLISQIAAYVGILYR
jgi:hypothetical protein